MMENDIIICRCQEVTRQEILDAIEQGATTVDEETRIPMEQILPLTKRLPVIPLKIGILGVSEDE